MAKKAETKAKKKTLKTKKSTPLKSAKKRVKSKKKVSAIPKGYNSITPYLIVSNAAKAIEFYKKIFGAKEAMRMDRPDGKVGHAELKFGDSKIMLADECPEMGAHRPHTVDDCAISVHFYTKNVDHIVEKAVAAGATLKRPVEDMFYGDRSGSVKDPFGHVWYVSTHIEDVTPAKLRKRAAELYGKKH